VGGGMGCHLGIAQVGFERGHGVFIYNVKWNEWALMIFLMKNVGLMSNEWRCS